MRKIETIYEELAREEVDLVDYSLGDGVKAVTIQSKMGSGVAVDYSQIHNRAEELTVVTHELGHVKTGTTHRAFSPLDLVERHEYRANKWAMQRFIPRHELNQCFAQGVVEPWQLAEIFEVTEEFIVAVTEFYQKNPEPKKKHSEVQSRLDVESECQIADNKSSAMDETYLQEFHAFLAFLESMDQQGMRQVWDFDASKEKRKKATVRELATDPEEVVPRHWGQYSKRKRRR